jgi:hypothetical protein
MFVDRKQKNGAARPLWDRALQCIVVASVLSLHLAVSGCSDHGGNPVSILGGPENVQNLCRVWRGATVVSIVHPDSLVLRSVGEMWWQFGRDDSVRGGGDGIPFATWAFTEHESHLVLRYRSGHEEDYSITGLTRTRLQMHRSYSLAGDSLFAEVNMAASN